jgi:Skp family chaperone for outer membrane proteins
MIISNTANDNILWADPTYDITNEVVAALNKRMKK